MLPSGSTEVVVTEIPVNPSALFVGRRLSAPLARVVFAAAVLTTCLMVSREARATPGEILVITGTDVALRAAPDAKSRLIGRLDTNDRLMEFERRDGWVRGLLFGAIGKEGWVAGRYLKAETDVGQDGVLRVPSEAPDKARPAIQIAPTPSDDEEGAYVTRSRAPVYLYCLDCGLARRHETRGRRDRQPAEVREVPRRHFRDLKPPPVIRVVPRPAPVWGGEPRR